MYTTDVCAAQVLVRTGRYAVLQRKTFGYPLTAFVGRLCMLGGAWTNIQDRSPRDTAWRELSEELRPTQVLCTASALRHLGNFELVFPNIAAGIEYRIWNFVFELNLGNARQTVLSLTEGEIAILPINHLHRHTYAWGHDLLLQACGVSGPLAPVSAPTEGIRIRPLRPSEPVDYHEFALDGLRVNPLRSGDTDDFAPFRR